jgi:hypothetical protein
LLASEVAQIAARKKWQGGACVEVHVDPQSMMVDANEAVTVNATPWHKFEMAEIQAPVTATLTNVQSLDPQNMPVMSPATFTYVAGSHKGDSGTVNLKSTSKRGIGTGSATYTVRCSDAAVMCNPVGEVLDTDTCQCNCVIDPLYANASPNCKWVGTITVTGSSSGQWTDTTGGPQTTWSFDYTASFAVDSSNGLLFQAPGTITGTWHKLVTQVEDVCDEFTTTTDDSFSGTVSAMVTVESGGGAGPFQLFVQLPQGSGLDGTLVDGIAPVSSCGVMMTTDSMPDHVEIAIFTGTGTPTDTAFSGTSLNPFPVQLPDGSQPSLTLSWNLMVARVSASP